MLASKTGEVKFNQKVKQNVYDCGVYGPDNMTFTCTQYLAPFVYCDGQYYVMNKIGTWVGKIDGPTPKDDYAAYGERGMWLLMDQAKAGIFKALLAEFAAIGSAIFLDNYTYSHHGVDAGGNPSEEQHLFNPSKIGQPDCPFTPNILIDWLRGTINALKLIADGAELTNVKGMTGEFKKLQCKRGGIDMGEDLVMFGSVDLQHQGQKDGRTLRFLASDIWCRGAFGAKRRTLLVILGAYGYFYPKGCNSFNDSRREYVALTRRTSSNKQTYYEVPCYGGSDTDDAVGMPVDTIVFKPGVNSGDIRYELIATTTQRILLVNSNDNENGVLIYSFGKEFRLLGGSAAEVVKLDTFEVPLQASNTLGRGLFICSHYDNNYR